MAIGNAAILDIPWDRRYVLCFALIAWDILMKYPFNPGRFASRILRVLRIKKKIPGMAFGSWVDDYGCYYGLTRKLFETDRRYRNRLAAYVISESCIEMFLGGQEKLKK